MSKLDHPSTQLLERNIAHIKQKVLLVNPPELASVKAVLAQVPKEKVFVSCQDYTTYALTLAEHIPAAFETFHQGKIKFDQAVVFLPKSDAEIEMTLLWAASSVKARGEVVLIGQNDAGIKSAKKTLEHLVGAITFSDAARHSGLHIAQKSVTQHAFSLEQWWQTYEIPAPVTTEKSAPLTIYSLPGVFSHGKLDEGTALLLETLRQEPLIGNNILDWGCGAGAIGVSLASSDPGIKVDMVDSSALALESARKTIAANKLKNCRVFASSIFSDAPLIYDAIVANPPFHKGHSTYYADTESFLKTSASHLSEHGHIRIVANVFLRYEPLLEEQFGYVKTVAKTNKYKVLEAVKIPQGKELKKEKYKKRRPVSLDEDEEFG
jgi:16S rRNA (guanine1207-N2)-methyltransferase